jgi:hypothetical protein
VTEAEIEAFEQECLSEEAVVDQSCLERFERLEQFVSENSHLALQEDAAVACLAEEVSSTEEVTELATELDEVAANLACTEEDQKYVKESCGKQMACNMGRSVVTIVDQVAPDFITSRVQRSLASLLSAEENSSCMDEDQPDCLSEIYRAFISSLVGTFNSLRDIGSAIGGAFSNMRAYLFEKSEDLHTAADTTQDEATRFMDSPGRYIVEKLNGFKEGIDNWIKTQVFCQKWEGQPHSENSTCVEPLEGYSCLDCDDGINAFCAGAGFFISEGLLTVATAGTATGIGIAARVGVAATKAATVRGASVLAARVPALARLTNRASKTTRTATRTRRNTVLAAAINKYNRAKEGVRRFGSYLADTKVGRATGKVTDVAMAPLRLVDNLSNRAMETVLAGATKVGGTGSVSRLIRQTAREDFRLIRRANRGEEVASSGATRATRSLAGARTIRLTNRRRVADRERTVSREQGASPYDPERNSGSSDRREATPEQTRREEARREEERRQEEGRGEEGQGDETNPTGLASAGDSRTRIPLDSRNGVTRATRLAIGADLAMKGARAMEDIPAEALSEETIQKALTGQEVANIEGDQPLREQLNARTGAQFQNDGEAQRFASNMREIYNDPNRKSKILERLMERRGLNRREANQIYNSEKRFYNNLSGSNLFAPQGKYAEEQGEINDLIERIATIRSTIKEQDQELDRERETSRAQATPTATPTQAPTQANGAQVRPTPQATFQPGGAGTISSDFASPFPRGVATVEGGFQSETEGADRGGDEGEVSDLIKNNTEEPTQEDTKSDPPAAPETDPQARESSAQRLATMDFLSLLLTEVERGSIQFRNLNAREREMIGQAQERISKPLEIENIQVATISGNNGAYYLFKDFKNNRTVVLDQEGLPLSRVPEDII